MGFCLFKTMSSLGSVWVKAGYTSTRACWNAAGQTTSPPLPFNIVFQRFTVVGEGYRTSSPTDGIGDSQSKTNMYFCMRTEVRRSQKKNLLAKGIVVSQCSELEQSCDCHCSVNKFVYVRKLNGRFSTIMSCSVSDPSPQYSEWGTSRSAYRR